MPCVMRQFIDYMRDELNGCTERNEAPSCVALGLLQLLKVENETVNPMRAALDAYIDLAYTAPGIDGPDELDEAFREEIKAKVRQSPKAPSEWLIHAESTESPSEWSNPDVEAFGRQLVKLSIAGSYRWLREQWYVGGFGGDTAGEALKDKIIKRLMDSGLKQQCEIDAIRCWYLEIPPEPFEWSEEARRKWIREELRKLEERTPQGSQ